MKSLQPYRIIGALAAAFILFTGAGHAKDFPEISAKELKAKMDAGKKVTLINPLSEIEFNEKHIPGSVHIPLQEILTTDRLPADKNQLIVTYCLSRK